MARKTILLETAFWDKFSECSRALVPYADGANPAEIFEKISRWNDIYKFLCRSTVFTDSPLHELAEKAQEDPMLMHMLKSNGDGKMDLEFSEDPFPDLESNHEFECYTDYSSVFFTNTDHRVAARKHGVLNISMDTIWDQEKKFKDTGKAAEDDHDWAWNKMDILKENSNGMVLVDNYILNSNNQSNRLTIDYNLKELLRLMLPDSCPEQYVLSIFYLDDSNSYSIRNAHRKDYSLLIENFIKARKPHLNFILELFPATSNMISHHKDFHDRVIITNNVWVGSEGGFDLLKQSSLSRTNAIATKSTKTHGLYLGFGNEVAEWLDDSYEIFIKDANKCLKKYHYSTQNRLLL